MGAPGGQVGRFVGFTLLELLTVAVIVCLLGALVFPAISQGRAQAACVHCLSNLRSLAAASLSCSIKDARSLTIPAHGTAGQNELYDDGYFDFGGASGSAEMWDGSRVGPDSPRRAETRPLNRWLGLRGSRGQRCSRSSGTCAFASAARSMDCP